MNTSRLCRIEAMLRGVAGGKQIVFLWADEDWAWMFEGEPVPCVRGQILHYPESQRPAIALGQDPWQMPADWGAGADPDWQDPDETNRGTAAEMR
jgi:hypothetical protein